MLLCCRTDYDGSLWIKLLTIRTFCYCCCVCPLIRRDNSDNADTCINRKREGDPAGFDLCIYFFVYTALRFAMKNPHDIRLRQAPKSIWKSGNKWQPARGANAAAIKTKARQQRERDMHIPYIYIDICVCVCLYRAFNALKTNRETTTRCVYWHGANEARLEKLSW